MSMRLARGAVSFTGKQAIVTGAGSGIGAALCRALVAAGADVVCTDVDGDAAERTASPLGARARSARLDVTDAAAVQAAVDEVVAPGRPARPDVQQRRHRLGRRHRAADARPVERDHRRQHPRRRARRGGGLPADGRAGPRPHRQHRVDGRADRGRPDHQLRDDQARRRRAVAGAALGGRCARASACSPSARPRSRRRSWTRARSAGSSAATTSCRARAARPYDADRLAQRRAARPSRSNKATAGQAPHRACASGCSPGWRRR